MISYTIALFVVAALGGAVLATKIFKGELAPWPLSFLHAGLGAAGLLLLLVVVGGGQAGPRTMTALGILVFAAVGGFFLASLHARKTVAPKGAVIAHAAAAAIGLTLLVLTVL